MIKREGQLAESRAEVARLASQPVSEVTPSRRDFAQYVATQKQGLAVIARLGLWAHGDLVAQAQACDDAEVAALAVATAAVELALPDMKAIADATTAPVLRESLVLDRSQIYASRLHGADAVLLAAHELAADELQELVAVARSLHMAPVIEVVGDADIDAALAIAHVPIGLRCVRDQRLDIDMTLRLAAAIPQQRTLIVLPEVMSVEEAARLVGHCDTVVVGDLLAGADVAAVIGAFLNL